MKAAPLLQVLLLASVGRIPCLVVPRLSTPEEQPGGVRIGTLSGVCPPPYLLLGGVYLTVDEETGDVYTAGRKMDREALCPSQGAGYCAVTADVLVGPEQDVVKVTVVVEDVNDRAPHFETDEMRLGIPESAAVGTGVPIEAKAWDEDAGSNADLRYHLEGDEGFFSVAQDGLDLELVVERGLDRETRDEHRMLLVAVDGGSVALSGTVSLVIAVLDVDDNCPQFSPGNPENVTVPAGAARDTPVAHIESVDPDLATESRILYSFSPLISDRAKELFSLDQATGRIVLARDSRLRVPEEHVLRVVMTSTPCPTEQAQLSVRLLPLEDQEPSVEIKYLAEFTNQTIAVRENEPPTILAVLTLRGVASPSGACSALRLEDAGAEFLLKAQADSCLLSTSKPLDFELCRDYEISVVMSDPEGRRVLGRRAIRVAVLDVNDNAPRFERQNYQVEIEENNEPGAALTRVTASDPDGLLYGTVAYQLIGSTPGLFSLDRDTGVLRVLESLDRERQEAYTLTVLAQDHGSPALEALAYVSITVLDQNDNSPTFAPPRFVFFISESIAKLERVGKLGVFDADAGDNGTVVAVRVLDADAPFAVDVAHMVLRCTGTVDRERQDRYDLLVQATDGGSPGRSSTASVTVFIEDVNDNRPEVVLPDGNFSCLTLPPDAKAGSAVADVHAVDRDSGVNSDITYHMAPGAFRIDPRSGNITLARPLQVADHGMHHLYVRVSDGGRPAPLRTAVWINVLVNETSGRCNLTSVPQYSDSYLDLTTLAQAAFKTDTSCTDPWWYTLLCALGVMAFSVFALLASAVMCLRSRKAARRRGSVERQGYSTETNPLKDGEREKSLF